MPANRLPPSSDRNTPVRYLALFASASELTKALLVALQDISRQRPDGNSSLPSLQELNLSLTFATHSHQVLILLGGTSGCGKSTLASLLAHRLGNSLASLLSTDAVRHSMRSHSAQPDAALQHSTYEVGSQSHSSVTGSSSTSQKNSAIIRGFKAQSDLVMQMTSRIIHRRVVELRESLIVEGVHLTIDWMIRLMVDLSAAGVCVIPFFVWIESEEKHRRRFAVRGKYMALQTSGNKYVRNHRNIRVIQEFLRRSADRLCIPKINNSSMDRSLSALHMTIFDALQRWCAGDTLFDQNRQEYRLALTKPMSSKETLRSIEAKKKRRHSTSDTPRVPLPAGRAPMHLTRQDRRPVMRNQLEHSNVSRRRFSLQTRELRRGRESEEEPFSCPSVASDENSDDGTTRW